MLCLNPGRRLLCAFHMLNNPKLEIISKSRSISRLTTSRPHTRWLRWVQHGDSRRRAQWLVPSHCITKMTTGHGAFKVRLYRLEWPLTLCRRSGGGGQRGPNTCSTSASIRDRELWEGVCMAPTTRLAGIGDGTARTSRGAWSGQYDWGRKRNHDRDNSYYKYN